MLQTEPPVKVICSTGWDKLITKENKLFVEGKRCDKEVSVKLLENGVAILKCDHKYGVANGSTMILPIEYESVVVVENGWTVACKYGIYDIFDSKGRQYKGLSFLKKTNAIKFARTL